MYFWLCGTKSMNKWNKSMTANQAFCSGEHHGKNLCIIKMVTYVLCSTAGSIDIWVSAPCLQILVLFSKFWNDSCTSAGHSSKIILKNFWHLHFQDVPAAYYPSKGAIHTSPTRTAEISVTFTYSCVSVMALEAVLLPHLRGSVSQRHHRSHCARS